MQITIKIFRNRKMFPGNFGNQGFKSKKGWEALHLYQLRLILPFIINANSEIKSNEMRVVVFIWHIQMCGDSIFCIFFKIGINDQVNYFFTALNDFLFKNLVNKNRSLGHSKIQLTRVNI